MYIDEAILEGTLGVISTIFRSTLDLAENDVKKHGLVISAGDQLSLALFDEVCICISVVSLFDYLIRFRPFDATTATSWIMSDSIPRIRIASSTSNSRTRVWLQMSSGAPQIQNRHGRSGKWIVSWVRKLSQPARKQNHSRLFVPSMSWHLIWLYPPTFSTDFAYTHQTRNSRVGCYWDVIFLVINAWICSTTFFLSTNVEDEVTFLSREWTEVIEKDDQFGDGWWQVCTILTIYNNRTIDRHLIRS